MQAYKDFKSAEPSKKFKTVCAPESAPHVDATDGCTNTFTCTFTCMLLLREESMILQQVPYLPCLAW